VQPNPKAAHFREGSEARRKMDDFNRTYMAVLRRLEYSFNEAPWDILERVGGMYDLKYKAIGLMNIPYGQCAILRRPARRRAECSDQASSTSRPQRLRVRHRR